MRPSFVGFWRLHKLTHRTFVFTGFEVEHPVFRSRGRSSIEGGYDVDVVASLWKIVMRTASTWDNRHEMPASQGHQLRLGASSTMLESMYRCSYL